MGLLDLFEGGLAQPPSLGMVPPSAPPQPPADPYSRYDTIYDEVSKETGIPAAILKAQTMQESSFNPDVVSKTGGVGLMQIQPSTAAKPGYGVEPIDPAKLTDPAENIRFGARYLAARAKSEGVQNWDDPQQVAKALAAYNGGGDPNYVQNVFRHLKPPGGAQPQASEPASAKPQAQDGTWVAYANQSAIRNKPLQPELVSAMSFLPQMGITMRVNSGGQEGIGEGRRRTGSTRHDHGGAGDVQFLRNGKPLSWENPNDIPVLQQIVRQARQNGVTGIGAGPGYMNPTTTHIGFGKPAIWGAKGGSPYAALAEAVGNTPIGSRPAGSGQPMNPTLVAAAERGRGPAADRPARAAVTAEGQMPMARRQMVDTTSADNAGVLEFLRQQAGMGQETMPVETAQGGLGGLGGFRIPGATAPAAPAPSGPSAAAQPVSVESLIPAAPRDPFAIIGKGAAQNQQWELERQGRIAMANEFVRMGMDPQRAVALSANPDAAKLALSQIAQARTAAADKGAVGLMTGQGAETAAPAASASVMNDPALKGTTTTTRAQFSNVLRVLADPSVSKVMKDAAEKQFAALLEDSKLTSEQKTHLQAKAEGFTGGILEMKERLARAGKTDITVKNEGSIPAGYQVERDAQGNPLRMVPIPGGPAAEKAAADAKSQEAKAATVKAQTNNVLDAVSTIEKTMAGAALPTTGGAGAWLAKLPGTAAHDISNLVDTIEANVAFGKLNEMRAQSPTGGALGSVTERELALLGASLASLKQSQSADQFKRNLGIVRETYLDILHGPGKRPAAATAEKPAEKPAEQKAAPAIRDGARAKGPNGQIIILRNGQWVPE